MLTCLIYYVFVVNKKLFFVFSKKLIWFFFFQVDEWWGKVCGRDDECPQHSICTGNKCVCLPDFYIGMDGCLPKLGEF